MEQLIDKLWPSQSPDLCVSMRVCAIWGCRANENQSYPDVNELAMSPNHTQGFLLPPWYEPPPSATQQDMDIASMLFGSSLALGVFTLVKGAQQTVAAFRGRRLRNIYVFLIWATWLPSLAMSIHTWLYVVEVVQPR